jgi:hypothetical protein
VKKALNLPEIHYKCYTDSQIALHWIKGDANRYKPFVANRVQEIQDLTDPSSWSHVAGKENPADLLTRGLSAVSLKGSSVWIKGPDFLIKREAHNIKVETIEEPSCEEESKCEIVSLTTTMCALKQERLFPIERWSSLRKCFKVIEIVLKFLNERIALIHEENVKSQEVPEPLNREEKLLILDEQRSTFATEIEDLKSKQQLNRNSKLLKLQPFIDKMDILRVKGRLDNSEMSYGESHPIILERGWLAKLIVREVHQTMKHAGIDTILATVRKKYWIIGLRRVAKEVISECMNCQKIIATRCNQSAGVLPTDRVCQNRPFEVTGVDHAGPLYASDDPHHKLYICLFTCAVTRSVHLELSDCLSAEEFAVAFRRFAARRNMPKIVYSDNAKTFKGVQKIFKSLYGSQRPVWKYIAPRSPWRGGWWERMVRTVKTSLKKCLGKHQVAKSELVTLLTEIEFVVNSRTLIHITDNIDDRVPLTPNNFLIMEFDWEKENIIKAFHSKKQILQKFWNIWATSYLQSLPKVVPQFFEKGKLKVGSLVLIQEDNVSRIQWPLGRIIKTMLDHDDKIRTVVIKTSKGEVVRPVQRLYCLEAIEPIEEKTIISYTEEHTNDDVNPDKGQEQDIIQDLNSQTVTADLQSPILKTRSGRTIKTPTQIDV